MSSTSTIVQRLRNWFFVSCLLLPLSGTAQTLDVVGGIQTYVSLTNTTINLSGKCELHLTATNNMMTTITAMDAMPGCLVNLNSPDAWLFLDGTRPYRVNLNQVYINGAAAVNGSNMRMTEYGMGTVVIPQSPGYLPLMVFSGAQFTGSSNQLSLYTYYNGSTTVIAGETGNVDVPFSGAISSFILKRGYAATLARNADGSGPSRVYIAADGDIQIGVLPPGLNSGVGFVRCYPWIWKPKKGWAGGDGGDALMVDAPWCYDWGSGANSSASCEYSPMQWGNGYGSSINNKRGSTLLLGFNEPDSASQANMTTAVAINDWTNLMNSGLRLGSPAPTDGGVSGWLFPFINAADAAGMRVDTVEQHMYMCGQTAGSLQNWMWNIHVNTGRRVGLTEFNNGANWTTCAQPTLDEEAATIQSFIQMMDSQPWVEGYNIYEWVQSSRMMTTNGVLTPAGTNYLNEWSPIAYIQELSGNPKWSLAVNGGVGPTNATYTFNGDALDSSGNGNNGLLAGSRTFVTGQSGQALQFDGVHDYVVLPPNAGKSANFTFAAWIKWNGGVSWQRIFDLSYDINQYLFLTPSSGANTLRFAITTSGGAGEQQLNTTALTPGVWTHVAVTINGGTAKLFVNGTIAATGTLTINPSSIPLIYSALGKSQFPADPLFKGVMDEVTVYGYALTDAQIASLAVPPGAPAAPTGPTATAVSANQINLSWTSSSGATSYNVKRATVSGGPYTTVATGVTATSYSDTGLAGSTTYYYVVSAVNGMGEGANSTQASATTSAGAPGAPTGLAATPGNGQVSLSWTAASGATGYNVKRATTSGGPYTTIASTSGTSYVNSGLVNYTTYYYVVSATNSLGEGGNSTEAAGTPAIVPGNFGFETPTTTTYVYNPSGASWTFTPQGTGVGSGVTVNGSGFTAGNAVAPQGTQVAFLQAVATISQSLSGFTPGTAYTVTFATSQRQNKSGGQAGQTFDVKIDSTVIGSFEPPQSLGSYTNYSVSFTASAATHTLTFSGTDLHGGDNTAFLDNVRITSATPLSPPAPPTGLGASPFSASQINLSWTASSGATSYNVKRATTSGGPYTTVATGVTAASYLDTGLAGGTYYYVVSAVNGAGESANSAQASAATLSAPAAPTGLTATTVSSSQINLSWIGSSGANSYNVKRSTVNGGPYTTVAQGMTATSYSDTKDNAGITYYYVVTAVGLNGESANSAQASTTTLTGVPAAPTGLSGVPGHSQVSLSWSGAFPNANSYNVKRATLGGGPYTTIATGVTATSYTDTSVTDYTTYYYVVSGVNAYGESANSSEVNVTPAIIPGNYSFEAPATGGYTYNPSGASWTFDANSGISANGSAFTSGNASAPDGFQSAFLQKTCFVAQVVSGFLPGTSYTVSFWASQRQNKSGGQAGQTLDVLVDNTFLVTSLAVPQANTGYTQYSYTFTAGATAHTLHFNGTDLNTGDNTLLIDDVQITQVGAGSPPPTPSGLTATAVATNQINLSWTASSGATSYNVKRATVSGGPYTTIATGVTGTAFNDTGLASSATYYYVVSAVNGSGESANSAQASATTPAPSVPPSAPTGLTATAASSSQINLSWTASSGATSYNVKRATVNGGPYTTIATGVTTTSFTDAGLAGSTTYYYVVSAVNSSGESANSTQASATTPAGVPAAPTGLSATAGNNQVVLSWNASSGATSYNVKRATVNGGPYTTIASPATASYTDTTAVNGTTYYYVVSAVNTSGESANSTQASATPQPPPPAAPTGLAATGVSSSQINLSWTASSGATSYNVKRATVSGGPYTTITSGVTTTTYSDTTAASGTTYYYVVSGVNGGGEGANSTQASATTIPAAPTGLGATAGNAQVALSWTASTGATSYNVKRATVSGGPYTTVGTSTTASYTDTTAVNGTTYYYVVSAVNGTGESANSSEVSATPSAPAVPAAPTGLTATAKRQAGKIGLAWNASSGATSYNVKRATVNGGPYTTVATGVTLTSYTDSGLTTGTTYYYVVSAVNGAGESSNSTQASATSK